MVYFFRLCAGLLFTAASPAVFAANTPATTGVIEEVRVSGNPLPVTAIGQAKARLDITHRSALRLDEQLKQIPGLSLFRRTSSLTAHPTTQGLSARGVGANGAGRVLVTLDGAPLNNPFGGWVYWSSINPRDIAEVTVHKGGSASAFGPQGVAGTVSLQSLTPEENGGYVATEYGEFNSYNLSVGASRVAEKGYLSLSAGRFRSDGPQLLSSEQRGSIDVPAASSAKTLSVRGGVQLSSRTRATGTVRYFQERRTNGLAAALNDTLGLESSFRLVRQTDDHFNWELLGYYRTTDFANVFASARDNRTTERPVLDQFDVPSRGGGLLARLQFGDFEVGIEGRHSKGETNERFRNLGQGFTRQRIAGGEQRTVGLFADFHRQGEWGAVSLSSRLDRYRTFNGQRSEQDINTGNLLREDNIANRSGSEFSGRAGLYYPLNKKLSLNAAAYRSWRLPTINEFYRPFRVVNDITEANPGLLPETLYGAEVGITLEFAEGAKATATVYRNQFDDSVGNITIGFGPGFFPLGGFVPSGGVLRQRANIDLIDIDGLELEGEFKVGKSSDLVIRYLYTDSRISRFAANQSLLGNRPVQTPRHGFFSAFSHRFTRGWVTLQGRYSGNQFDDDLNQRELAAVFTANLSASYPLNDSLTLSLAVENLFDRKVVSALTASGLETLGQQRFWRIGMELQF
ncbi:TonB-dependent receptor [Porticoccus sp. GXU_MW_L64]